MAITAETRWVHNAFMNKPMTTAVAPAPGRGTVTRISNARRVSARRDHDISRARDARRGLGSRSERFAHLKRMHD